MESIKLTTLEHIKLDEMVEVWNRCWQGYYYDMAYSIEHMKFWLELGQVVLPNSIAICSKNQVVGFALLAVNNFEGWIAGTCIDPRYRGKGLFAPLMRSQLELAARIGLRRVNLEVLIQNHAQKVYQSVGFARVRQLHVYRTTSGTEVSAQNTKIRPFKHIPVTEYFENRENAFFNPAWQRRRSYLERYKNVMAFINSASTAGILISRKKNAPILDVWSATAAGAEEIISKVLNFRNQGFSLINQPEDWIVAALRVNGIQSYAQQYEMCIDLA